MCLVSVCKRVFSVGFGPGWTECLPQGAGALLAMLRGRMTGFPQNTWGPGPPEMRDRWIQFAQSLWTVAHQPRAGCIHLVQLFLYLVFHVSEAVCCTTCTDNVFLHLLYKIIDSDLFFVILLQIQDDLLKGLCWCGVIRPSKLFGGGIVMSIFFWYMLARHKIRTACLMINGISSRQVRNKLHPGLYFEAPVITSVSARF